MPARLHAVIKLVLTSCIRVPSLRQKTHGDAGQCFDRNLILSINLVAPAPEPAFQFDQAVTW